jgi:hypothetical protein
MLCPKLYGTYTLGLSSTLLDHELCTLRASLGATKPEYIRGAKISSLFNFELGILGSPIPSSLWTLKLALIYLEVV